MSLKQTHLPSVGVIVPGHNAGRTLEACLSSLRKQDWPGDRFVLVFVDDASTDDSREIAERFVDRMIVSTGTPRGPAAARNLGVEFTPEDIIIFFDADVVAPPPTVSALLKPLLDESGLDAVFGSYDREPAHKEVVSQYRNLLHYYTHQNSNEEASTFWAGCGAVRRKSFRQVGGFDVNLYPKPMIEDIELGHRMRAAGMRIRLKKDAQVKHLKKWTVREILRADIFRRGIPWMKLLLNERGRSSEIGDLNLTLIPMLSIPLTWGAILLSLFSFRFPVLLPVSLAALVFCVLINLRTHLFFYRVRGLGFAAASIPLYLLYHCCNGISTLGGLLGYMLAGGRRLFAKKRPADSDVQPKPLPFNAVQVIECANKSR